jgi:hypothetical protein
MDAEPANLNNALCVGRVDDAELVSFLLQQFGYANSGLTNEVHFSHRNNPSTLKLTYRDGEIASADGTGLKPEEVALLADKVRRELVESPGKIAARSILFSAYRVSGCFIYDDKLRILPLPKHAPMAPDLTEQQCFSEHLNVEHPFIIEFPINRSVIPVIQIQRLENQTRKYCLLLNVFLEGQISRPARGQERHWIHEEGAELSSGYRYCREDYRYPGFADIGPGFSSTEGIPPMETMEYYEYFGNPRQDLNPPMRVPALLATFFDRFEALGKSEQHHFLRSAHWFHHASGVWRTSNSAAYLAIISSIETLRPSVPPTDKCESCGAPRGKGATRQFVDFLNAMAPAYGEDVKEREKLYRLRSALTHGGDLFQADTEALWGLNPKSTAESHSYFTAMSLARRALLGWLMEKTGGWPMPS